MRKYVTRSWYVYNLVYRDIEYNRDESTFYIIIDNIYLITDFGQVVI